MLPLTSTLLPTFIVHELPPIDHWTQAFSLWLDSRPAPNTRRAYRKAWELFIAFTRTLEALDAETSQSASANPMQPGSILPPGSTLPPNGHYCVFTASEIVMSYGDKGQPTYKIKGGPYVTYGVRVWHEVLPDLGIDPASLKPGPNLFNAQVRALMGEKGP